MICGGDGRFREYGYGSVFAALLDVRCSIRGLRAFSGSYAVTVIYALNQSIMRKQFEKCRTPESTAHHVSVVKSISAPSSRGGSASESVAGVCIAIERGERRYESSEIARIIGQSSKHSTRHATSPETIQMNRLQSNDSDPMLQLHLAQSDLDPESWIRTPNMYGTHNSAHRQA